VIVLSSSPPSGIVVDVSESSPPKPPLDDAASLVPVEPGGPALKDTRGTAAGGIGAVVSSLAYTLDRAGPVRGLRVLARLNQSTGFDCPGCAWPDPEHRALAEFCENGARAVADEADKRKVGPTFFGQWSIERLSQQSDHWLNRQGRLTHPMWRKEGAECYEEVTWDEAFAKIGATLRGLAHPDEAVFYTSGRTSNEAAFLYQLFARKLGTNNLPDCSNMCHESSGVGLGESIGIGKATVQLADFTKTALIFVIGQNPGTNHPRMLSALRDAKRAGAKIISINPLREVGLERFKHPQKLEDMVSTGVPLTDVYLQVKINGDVALLKGIMKEVMALEESAPGTVVDRAFIESHCEGYDAWRAALDATSWGQLEEKSGIPRAQMREVATMYAAAPATIACWAMGLTQHANGVANIQEVVNLLLLRGNIGRPGAGVCPVRGHSNVQGDRTMGISHEMPDAFFDRLETSCGVRSPRDRGMDVVDAIHAMERGEVRCFVGMGGNFVSATPDSKRTSAAMQRCALTVHVSTKLNRSHLVTGSEALILPCLGRTELDMAEAGSQFVTVENSMGVVHASRGRLKPSSTHLRSEPSIIAGVAQATFEREQTLDWSALAGDYDRIRDLIEATIPGFERYNERVRVAHGFVLPNGPSERNFTTKTGRANFIVHELPQIPLEEGQMLMMTIRSHDQYNTTVYDLNDRYRGIHGFRRVVLMNREDIAACGVAEGDRVDIVSHFRGSKRRAPSFVCVPYDIPRGCVATYFPEANVLVPLDSFAARSRTPTSKSVVVTLHARGEGSPARS